MTNEVGNYKEISAAICQHWQIEADNYVRDVSLQEDALRSQSTGLPRVLAGARTVVLEVLKKIPCPNKKAQLEHFTDNFEDLLRNLRAYEKAILFKAIALYGGFSLDDLRGGSLHCARKYQQLSSQFRHPLLGKLVPVTVRQHHWNSSLIRTVFL